MPKEPKRFTTYIHHGKKVWVEEHLKELHRDHCLCHSCIKFKPESLGVPYGGKNCKMAAMLYALCRLGDMVTPVYECPRFNARYKCVD